jgi:hypothetical protein
MVAIANLKTLKLHPVVEKQVRIFDEFLSEVGAASLFENPYVDWDDLTFENYLKFRLWRPDRNSVTFDFHFKPDGMQIDVFGFPEAYEFAERDILEESKVREMLERLITCPVLVERKRGSQFVNLFNPDGSRYAIWSLQSFTGLIFRGYWKSQTIDQNLYEPIYPRTSNK